MRGKDGRWALHFDEAIDLKSAKFTVPDVGDARVVEVLGGGRILRLELPDEAPVLEVVGLADTADPPNVSEDLRIPLSARAWPPVDAAPCFVWAGSGSHGVTAAAAFGLPYAEFAPKGLAYFDFDGAMRVVDGLFVAEGEAHDAMIARCREAGEFSVECLIEVESSTPWNTPLTVLNSLAATAGGSGAVGSSDTGLPFHFGIYRRANDLLFAVSTDGTKRRSNRQDSRVEHALMPRVEQHVILSYGSGEMEFFGDGQPAYIRSKVEGALRGWADKGSLIVGGGWQGRVRALAVYPRKINAADAARHFDAARRFAVRKGAGEPLRVLRGTFLRSANFPDLAQILPYRDALVLGEYRVDVGSEGFEVGETALVARFALRDGRALSVRDAVAGERVELRVGLLEDHEHARSLFRSEVEDADPLKPVWFTLDALQWAE